MLWFSRKKGSGGKTSTPASGKSAAKPSSADIRAQAMKNVRQARAAIGEETLDKIAAAMRKKQSSDFEKAKEKIKSLDNGRVADNIRAMIDEKE